MASAEGTQQLKEMTALHAAQLEALIQELTTQQAATAEAEVQSGMSLVDTKLLTKPHMYSGEHDGKE